MGLSSFGGRPSSSGGSSGGGTVSGNVTVVKDVGESMLVPIPFQHTDFTDTGVDVTNAQFPQLFQRLSSGAKPVNYSDTGDVGSALAEVRATTKAASISCECNGELITIHTNGVVTASTDGLTYTYRGQMPSLFGITSDLFFPGVLTGNIAVKGNRILATSVSRGFGAAWYSDDGGATWTRIEDSILSGCLLLSAPFRQRPVSATATHFFYYEVSGAKRIIRSADGITWEYVTTTPAFTGTVTAFYADPLSGVVIAHLATQNGMLSSRDSGETWTINGSASTANPTGNIIRFGDDYYYATFVSSSQQFYKSVNGGETWTASGVASSIGGAGMGNIGVAGGKICCIGTSTFATNGKHIISSNGSIWTLVTSPAQTNGRYPQFFADKIVFFRDHAAVGTEKPTVSYDGTTVGATALTSSLVMPSSMNGAVLVSTGNRLLAFSSQSTSQYAYTDDGLTWQSADMPVTAIWHAGVFDPATNKIYVTTTTLTSYFESSDFGLTWTEVPVLVPTCSAASTVPMVCGNLIAFPHSVSASRAVFLLSEPDASGIRTQIRSTGAWATGATGASPLRTIPFRAGFLSVSATANSVAYVQDALRTTAVQRLIGIVTTAGAYGSNSTISFVATAGSIAYSTQTDLVTWTVKTLPLAQTWTKAIQLNDTQFLLIAAGSFKALLGDGISWEVIDMDGIPFDDFNNAVMFKGNVYIFSADKSTKATRSLPSNKRYIPRVVSPVDGFKYVVRAKA